MVRLCLDSPPHYNLERNPITAYAWTERIFPNRRNFVYHTGYRFVRLPIFLRNYVKLHKTPKYRIKPCAKSHNYLPARFPTLRLEIFPLLNGQQLLFRSSRCTAKNVWLHQPWSHTLLNITSDGLVGSLLTNNLVLIKCTAFS